MRRSNKILRVPADPALRDRLRREAAILLKERVLLPPASFDTLELMAVELIRKLEVSEEYTDFAIVLIGNESWRPTIAATPFHRRLLLLPQCLKSDGFCKGSFDELGLLCAGCKGCIISDVLSEVEDLGYTTLVAEGTTVAIGLVEEGSIDAVIGVSCMPVLQRSFDQVSKAAVPVIGLPLMYDGCSNTNVDNQWLLDELRTNVPNNQLEPLSASLIKTKVQEYFTDLNLHSFFHPASRVELLAKEMMSQGGHRMRPLMSVLSYLAYSEEKDEKITMNVAMIIECFHKASLVHDDIEDNSDQRYNNETLHKKHGVAMAINVGDYLIGKGYHLLTGLPLNNDIITQCLQVISLSHVRLTLGQGADIMLDPWNEAFKTDLAFEIFRLKTGEAVKVALLLGAIAGCAPESDLRVLEIFSESFGIAYQIRDDLSEFREKNEGERLIDFPFLVALFNENSAGRGTSNQHMQDDPATLEKFRESIDRLDIVSKAETILREYIDKCYLELDKLQNLRLRLSLYGVMGKIFPN